MRAVIDTNVWLGAILSERGSNRQVLRKCLQGRVLPIMGQALFLEYEDVLSRDELFLKCAISKAERQELFDALLSVSEWVRIYFGWRPNLPDEGDNHLVELAVAGRADWIVSHNLRHLAKAELKFPGIGVVTPEAFLEVLR